MVEGYASRNSRLLSTNAWAESLPLDVKGVGRAKQKRHHRVVTQTGIKPKNETDSLPTENHTSREITLGAPCPRGPGQCRCRSPVAFVNRTRYRTRDLVGLGRIPWLQRRTL